MQFLREFSIWSRGIFSEAGDVFGFVPLIFGSGGRSVPGGGGKGVSPQVCLCISGPLHRKGGRGARAGHTRF